MASSTLKQLQDRRQAHFKAIIRRNGFKQFTAEKARKAARLVNGRQKRTYRNLKRLEAGGVW